MRRMALIALFALTVRAGAQTPLADSAQKLVRASLWNQAGEYIQAGLQRTTSQDDRCGLVANAIYALAQMGALESARQELEYYDQHCADVPVAATYAPSLASVRSELNLPPLPRAGLDFSGVDQFWKVADLLAKDVEPSDADWRALFTSVGYRLAMRMIASTRSDFEIALMPSKSAARDSVAKLRNDTPARVTHIASAYAHRAELARYRDSVSRALPVQQAIALASKFLPPHATDGKQPPLVAFAIFRNDAYSLGPEAIIVDLERVRSKGDLTLLLAHEFHHSFLAGLDRVRFPSMDDRAATLVHALMGARNEGIADLIDKPYPLPEATGGNYAKTYNAAYARTPEVIHSIDSLLAIAADDSTRLSDVGRRVANLLPSNGHYNGSYVAREIYETFGVDSLFPAVYNPFALWRTYGEAEAKHGRPWPFSPKSQALLDAIESKYVKQPAVP